MDISLKRHPASYSLFDSTRGEPTDLELLWFISTACSAIYAQRHFVLAKRNPDSAFGHYVLGILEAIPALGLVVALIEVIVYQLFGSLDKSKNRDTPFKTNFKTEPEEEISVPIRGLYGLRNDSGSDCFLISDLQMILNNRSWMEWAETADDLLETQKVWKEIAQFHKKGTLYKNIRTIRTMLVNLTGTRDLAFGQQDAQEALCALLDALPKQYKMQIEINRPGRALKTEPFSHLSIPLTEAIQDYFNAPHPETLQKVDPNDPQENSLPAKDADGQIIPGQYEEETVLTTLSLKNAVPHLVVHLKRFDNDLKKIKTPYEILKKFDIQTDGKTVTYNLTSIIHHSGSTLLSGHYTNYRKVGDVWFLLNDNCKPAQLSEDEVLQNAATSCYILNYSSEKILSINTEILNLTADTDYPTAPKFAENDPLSPQGLIKPTTKKRSVSI